MTKFTELPLRPHGQNWPGLNTRRGYLSNGTGELEDGSINAIIERGDVLMKRRGLSRGLDERFEGVVCGLFKYTDSCGIEWLLVADEEGIKVRQPFDVPVGETSDAYPQDTFSSSGAPNALRWRNTGPYTQVSDALTLLSTQPAGTAQQVASSRMMRWFKDAANPSYQVQVQYEFDTSVAVQQRTSIVIRGFGDLSVGALLQLDLVFQQGSAYRAVLWHRRVDSTYRELLRRDVPSPAQASGFLTLRYLRDVSGLTNLFIPGFNLVANGGVTVDDDAPTLLETEDQDLGLTSAIGMDRSAVGAVALHRIHAVDGGPL